LKVKSFNPRGLDYISYGNQMFSRGVEPENGMPVDAEEHFVFYGDSGQAYSAFDICCIARTEAPTEALTKAPTEAPSQSIERDSETSVRPIEGDSGDSETPSQSTEGDLEQYVLVFGDSVSKGNVYLNGLPICHESWGDEEADVVCRKMGFDYGISTCCSAWGYVDERNFIMNNVDCNGGESTIWDCQYTNLDYCSGWEAAGVECFNDDGYWTTSKVVIVSVSVTLTFICCFVIGCSYRFSKNNQAESHKHVEVNITSLNSATDKEGNTVSSGDVETSGTGGNEGEREAETSGPWRNEAEQDSIVDPVTSENDTVAYDLPPPANDPPPEYDL